MDTGVRRYDEKANTQNESLSVRFVSYSVAASVALGLRGESDSFRFGCGFAG
jgi:hypothetical protein